MIHLQIKISELTLKSYSMHLSLKIQRFQIMIFMFLMNCNFKIEHLESNSKSLSYRF